MPATLMPTVPRGLTLTSMLALLGLATRAAGHGMLVKPVSRALREAVGLPPNKTIAFDLAGTCPTGACEWYTQRTVIVGPKTNCNPSMRTMGVNCDESERLDWPCTPGAAVPWCKPGSAPVKSPCGVFSGGYAGRTGVIHSRDMLELSDPPMVVWEAGTAVEVGWAITANHGGGYAFRICKHGPDLSERCFQAGHLNFAGTTQSIVNTTGHTVAVVPALRISDGTIPPRSEWTRNPFPQEADMGRRIPGLPELYGRGPFPFSMVDTVQVPANATPGLYVLSWRWDAEQTKQVWSHCSDVEIVAKGGKPAPPPPPPPSLPKRVVCTGASLGLDVNECDAWVDLFDALGGENWPAEWQQDCASLRTDPCGCSPTWQKNIICASNRDFDHITELYMLSSNLVGELPPSFTNFKQLRSLSFVDTKITGVLPTNMGDMAGLEMIWLDHNPELKGVVPASLAKLDLSVLELHRSGFEGTLPAMDYTAIPDCTLNDLVFKCPLPEGADTCGALCVK